MDPFACPSIVDASDPSVHPESRHHPKSPPTAKSAMPVCQHLSTFDSSCVEVFIANVLSLTMLTKGAFTSRISFVKISAECTRPLAAAWPR